MVMLATSASAASLHGAARSAQAADVDLDLEDYISQLESAEREHEHYVAHLEKSSPDGADEVSKSCGANYSPPALKVRTMVPTLSTSSLVSFIHRLERAKVEVDVPHLSNPTLPRADHPSQVCSEADGGAMGGTGAPAAERRGSPSALPRSQSHAVISPRHSPELGHSQDSDFKYSTRLERARAANRGKGLARSLSAASLDMIDGPSMHESNLDERLPTREGSPFATEASSTSSTDASSPDVLDPIKSSEGQDRV